MSQIDVCSDLKVQDYKERIMSSILNTFFVSPRNLENITYGLFVHFV